MPNASGSARPRDWPTRRLLDLVELPQGQVDPRSHPYCHWPLIAPDHVESATGRLLKIRSAEEQRAISGKYTVRPSDVVLSKIRPALRKVIRVETDALCSADMYPLRPRREIDSRFLFRLLLGTDFSVFAESLAGRSGIPKINRSELGEYKFSLPPLHEQLRVAEILDAADSSCQSAELELAKHQTLTDAMMRALLNSIDTSEMVSVGDCYSITAGLTLGPYRQALARTAPYLRVANVQRGVLDLRDITVTGIQQAERDRYSLKTGDLLVVEGHADPYQIGRCAQVNDVARRFLYQNHLFRLRSSNIAPEFGLAWLNSDTARAYWRANCATSSGLYTINGALLAQMPMPLPTGEAQNRVVSLTRTLNEAVEAAAYTLGKLRMVKKGLMDDLLTGRVRVSKSSA